MSERNILPIRDIYKSDLKDIVDEMCKRGLSTIITVIERSHDFFNPNDQFNMVVRGYCEVVSFDRQNFVNGSDVQRGVEDISSVRLSRLCSIMDGNGVSVAMMMAKGNLLSLNCSKYSILLNWAGKELRTSPIAVDCKDARRILDEMYGLDVNVVLKVGSDPVLKADSEFSRIHAVREYSIREFSDLTKELIREFKEGFKRPSQIILSVDCENLLGPLDLVWKDIKLCSSYDKRKRAVDVMSISPVYNRFRFDNNSIRTRMLFLTDTKYEDRTRVVTSDGMVEVQEGKKYDLADRMCQLGLFALRIPPSYKSDAKCYDLLPGEVEIVHQNYGIRDILPINADYSPTLKRIVDEMYKRDLSMMVTMRDQAFSVNLGGGRFRRVSIYMHCEVAHLNDQHNDQESLCDVGGDVGNPHSSGLSELYKQMADNNISVVMVIQVQKSLFLYCYNYTKVYFCGFVGMRLDFVPFRGDFDRDSMLRRMVDLDVDVVLRAESDISENIGISKLSDFVEDVIGEFKRCFTEPSNSLACAVCTRESPYSFLEKIKVESHDLYKMCLPVK